MVMGMDLEGKRFSQISWVAPTNEPLKADILSSVGERDVAKKEGRKMISMRGTQPVFGGFEDGG